MRGESQWDLWSFLLQKKFGRVFLWIAKNKGKFWVIRDLFKSEEKWILKARDFMQKIRNKTKLIEDIKIVENLKSVNFVGQWNNLLKWVNLKFFLESIEGLLDEVSFHLWRLLKAFFREKWKLAIFSVLQNIFLLFLFPKNSANNSISTEKSAGSICFCSRGTQLWGPLMKWTRDLIWGGEGIS